MNPLDSSPTTTTPRRAEDAPDWGLVRFPVRCPRCAHDLRGQSQPVCPQCDLDFQWHDLIPRDELRCEGCSYSLFGLRDLRCPECGRAFTWEGLLHRLDERSLPLHEFATHHRLSAMVRSWRWAARPRKLWNRVRLHHAPRPGALAGYALASVLLYAITLALSVSAALWLGTPGGWMGATNPTTWLLLLGELRTFVTSSGFGLFMLSYVAWAGASLAALMIIADSMFRHNVRAVHAVRVWTYAVATYPVLGALLLAAGVGLCTQRAFRLRTIPELFFFAAAALVVVALTARSIRIGYSDYLRIPHARAIAWLTQIIAVLVMMLAQFLLSGDDVGRLYGRALMWLGA